MVVIQIESGKIKGKICDNERQEKFFSFQNIPYATPPIGQLRFKAPQPVKPWTGIRDATEEGNVSISRHLLTKKLGGSEDCLNLNVYTPELPQKNKPLKPVMFWIHGGLFMTGSNKTDLFGPEFLMKENIVLVTINYRLGILGFLSLEDASLGVPGNAGFKDMVMALKWVQKNIANFGGDPHNVTVFGESAGAAAAHLLMLSPMAKGLFHKVIAQSASALNTWVHGRRSAVMIAKCLGLNSFDDKKILQFLEKIPAMELLKAQIKLDVENFVEYDLRFFGLVIERPSNEETFINRPPAEIILSGDYNHVPLIMGYNESEGMSIDDIVPSRTKELFFENLELSVPLLLKIQRGSTLSYEIADKIRKFYFGESTERRRDKHLKQYYNLSTDTSFLRDVYFSVKHHLTTATKPIYFYKLNLETQLNIFKTLTGATMPGVYHGDDVSYIFKTMFTPDFEPDSIEDVAQKRFTRMWANFARCGNPTPDSDDNLIRIKWKEVDEKNFNYLEIGKELTMMKNPEAERMAFWKDIYKLNPAIAKL